MCQKVYLILKKSLGLLCASSLSRSTEQGRLYDWVVSEFSFSATVMVLIQYY